MQKREIRKSQNYAPSVNDNLKIKERVDPSLAAAAVRVLPFNDKFAGSVVNNETFLCYFLETC